MFHLKNFSNFCLLSESIILEKMPRAAYKNETVLSLPYTGLIKENRQDFLKKLVRISKDLQVNPIWLLHTINHESGFDPKKQDKLSKSVGILSFHPQVIENFIDGETGKGYKTNDVLQMSNVEQLDLVKSFYKTWFEKMKLKLPIVAGDFASLTLYPETIKKDWDWEFPSYVALKNPQIFEKFAPTSRTKKDYYTYVEEILNSKKEYDINDGRYLGNFSGAFCEPSMYDVKKPLEFYKDLVMSIEDPSLGQKSEDEVTQKEKNKQNDNI